MLAFRSASKATTALGEDFAAPAQNSHRPFPEPSQVRFERLIIRRVRRRPWLGSQLVLGVESCKVLVEVVDHLLVVQLRRVYQATKIIE